MERLDDDDGEGDMAGEGGGELEGSGKGERGGGGFGDGDEGGTGGSEEGTGEGAYGGGSDRVVKNTRARVRLLNVRSIPISRRKRMIAFTPDFSGDVRIALEDSGADSNYALQVVSSNAGTVAQGMIDALKDTSGIRCILEIELSQDFDGAMKVTANAV
jgi:hypothetical protein